MNQELPTECPPTARRSSRHGKIARLPKKVREELNERLLDGESGKSLVQWLNELPETKAALERDFGGAPINEPNLSDWRQGGFQDWLAKTEAQELMDETLADCGLGNGRSGRASGSRRSRGHKSENAVESAADRVAGWFFPHYVAAARGQLTAAGTPAERWSVLRTICADLAGLRRSDHYVERLRMWREKLEAEKAEKTGITEEEVIAWIKDHPDIEGKMWPEHAMTFEEKENAMRQILGLDPVEVDETPNAVPSAAPNEAFNQGELS